MPETTPVRPLAIAPFDTWTYEDVVRELQLVYDAATYTIRKSYAVDHDHFRQGQEWIGPGDATTNTTIGRHFAPDDAIGEALNNVSNAFGEPQVGTAQVNEIDPSAPIPPDIQARMREATNLLVKWWDAQRLQELIQESQYMSAWAGQACLRLWIPSRFLLTTNGSDVIVRPTSDINEAASYVRVVAPLLEYAAVLVDAGTQDKAAVFMDEEVTYVGTERKAVKRAEISYLDPKRQTDKDAKTILRIVYSDARTPLRAELDLGGRLLMAQMDAASLLTDPVVRTQRQLNLLTTLVSRIAETAAFRERYTKNAKPQGSRIPYEEGDSISDGAFLERDEEGRTWQVIPEARTLGANTTTELVGLPQYDDRGDAKGNQMPDVVIVDPVDPKPYIAAADATRHRLLRMCAQGHLGGSSNAEVSGIAYEQARAVFEKDLNRRRVAEEGMLRDLLTAVLAMVEAITGKKGYFTDVLRVTVDQHINPGPRSPDLVRLDLEGFDAGVLSRETTMARLGVEDTTAEAARIRTSALYILSVIEQATKASLSEESFKQVLTELKLPAEIVDAIEFKVAPAPVVPPVEPDTSEIV